VVLCHAQLKDEPGGAADGMLGSGVGGESSGGGKMVKLFMRWTADKKDCREDFSIAVNDPLEVREGSR
jgi:hypothetical protein